MEAKEIALQMLSDLKTMLQGWGITPDDWYLTGELAMLLSDYPVDYRLGQIDVLVCRSAWPWEREEEQVSLFPDKETQEEAELGAFIKRHGITPDFHPLPHVGLSAEDRFEHTAWYPDEMGIRVLKPWAAIFQRGRIVDYYRSEHPRGLEVFDRAKYERWERFVEQTKQRADEIGDKETSGMCLKVLPIIQGAIDHFVSPSLSATQLPPLPKGDDKGESVRGQSVYPGKVTGQVMHWHEGADFTDRIAVLELLLPARVSFISQAKAIVTDQGGLLSHAATIAREYHIPTVINTRNATSLFEDGDEVEVDADQGQVRRV